jgi:hypothetical protein
VTRLYRFFLGNPTGRHPSSIAIAETNVLILKTAEGLKTSALLSSIENQDTGGRDGQIRKGGK